MKKQLIDFGTFYNFMQPECCIQDFACSKAKYDSIQTRLAYYYGTSAQNIMLYSGHKEALFQILLASDTDDCFIYSCAFEWYKDIATLAQKRVHTINRFIQSQHPITKGSIVLFANPSIPEGKYYNLESLFEYWKSQECTIMIDESLLDFCSQASVSAEIVRYHKLYIIKNLYFFGCEGVKISTVVSAQHNIQKLKTRSSLDAISTFDISYVHQALEDISFVKTSRAILANSKAILERVLEQSELFEYSIKSATNIVVAKLRRGVDFYALFFALKSYGIRVGDCTKFDFLDAEFIFFSLKSKKEIKYLEDVLKNVKKEILDDTKKDLLSLK